MTTVEAIEPATAARRLASLEASLAECLLGQRRALARRCRHLRQRLERGPDQRCERDLEALAGAIARSAGVVAERRALEPSLVCPPGLPIAEHLSAIAALMDTHRVVIVGGETGCGKSTQLPKLCLALGRGLHGRVGLSQPRRIAARAIARRIAEETGTEPGVLAGHCVRFDDNLRPSARIKVMTDGVLLNELHADRWLGEYDTLIIDEIHERSLNIDFLLGYLKQLLERRRDLKLVLTSATLDTALFERFFAGAACHHVPGRQHPVEIRYRPPEPGEEGAADLAQAVLAAVQELDLEAPGDALVFLPGEREIREVQAVLQGAGLAATEVHALFARASAERQARALQPGPARRLILATNVAETSLTVPRVRHVIDSGLARVSRYSPRRKLQLLPVERIAQANAAQRAGRCGREQPGVCIRLYGEADLLTRRAHTEPEIQRTNLAGVILRLKALGIEDVEAFPFAAPPSPRLLRDGFAVLQELGALDAERRLTTLGRGLVRYPVDPRLARVLLAAAELHCLAECLVIVAGLSIVDPRERPHELAEAADQAHAVFADRRSDFLWFVNAWPLVCELRALGARRLARRARRHFLSAVRLREWGQLHDYLARLVAEAGLAVNGEAASYRRIHQALATGFPSHVGEWQGDHYLGCRGGTFVPHPGSVLARHAPRWLLAAEIIESGRRYARIAARIDPAWVERAAPHLVRRSHLAPRWDVQRGAVRATEIVRLYGLTLDGERQVDYERIDVGAARALFIEQALVDGELGEPAPFLAHNLALVRDLEALEQRARRHDLLAPRAQRSAFYDSRLPPALASRRALRQWLREDAAAAARLTMSEADAAAPGLQEVGPWLFPDHLVLAGVRCPVEYRFEPGAADDGVTVTVPLPLLPRLAAHDVERLVPGLLSAKVEALLRALPKARRRLVAPLRPFAMAAVAALGEQPGALADALAAVLERMTGAPFAAADFDLAALPPHLAARVRVVDAGGRPVAVARDIARLRVGLRATALAAEAALDWGAPATSAGAWTFGVLPETEWACYGDWQIPACVALAVNGERVERGLFTCAGAAAAAHASALAWLLVRAVPRTRRDLQRGPLGAAALGLRFATWAQPRGPVDAFLWAAARRHLATAPLPRDAVAFARSVHDFEPGLLAAGSARAGELDGVLAEGARLRALLAARALPAASREDAESELAVLLGVHLVAALEAGEGPRVKRALRALARRLEHLDAHPGRDLARLERVAPPWQRLCALGAATRGDEPAVRAVLALFTDYRQQVFAPELPGACGVTEATLNAAIDALVPAADGSDG